MQKFISIDPLEPGTVTETAGLLGESSDFSPTGNYSIEDGRQTPSVEMEGRRERPLTMDSIYGDNSNNTITPFMMNPVQQMNDSSSRAKEQRALKEPKPIRK